jgi:hypothetical protein
MEVNGRLHGQPVSPQGMSTECPLSRRLGGLQMPFEHSVREKLSGTKREEVTGEWRGLHNKELYALYSSPNIIRVIKSRRLRWVRHVVRMMERRDAYRA